MTAANEDDAYSFAVIGDTQRNPTITGKVAKLMWKNVPISGSIWAALSTMARSRTNGSTIYSAHVERFSVVCQSIPVLATTSIMTPCITTILACRIPSITIPLHMGMLSSLSSILTCQSRRMMSNISSWSKHYLNRNRSGRFAFIIIHAIHLTPTIMVIHGKALQGSVTRSLRH